MTITQAIIDAAKAFDADNFGVQYYDEDENGVCIGEPDCLSLNTDTGVYTFHPQTWTFCEEIHADGQRAIELYREALKG